MTYKSTSMPNYEPGVPTPYSLHVHPYPTRFHGAIYTRPVFGFPMIARPEQVFTPGYDLSRGALQPPISGLGTAAVDPNPTRLWSEGDGIFRPGGYGGGVFDGNISGLGSIGSRSTRALKRPLRGLGADDADYPWKTVSEKTRQLQQATNESLVKAGLCPLTVDGKLGGATCGARNHLSVHSEKYFGQAMSFSNPSTCDAHGSELKVPTPKSQGCGGGGLTTLPVTTAATLPSSSFSESGMSSSTKRMLGFALGGVLAVGAVVMLRRKR